MELNYQQLLAEVYDDNAKHVLVHQNEYEDEEQEAYEKYDYSDQELEDKEEFNKFHGDRNKPEHVVNPESKSYKSRSRSDVRTIVLNIDGAFRGTVVPTSVSTCGPVESSNPGTLSSHFVMSTHKLYRNITSVKMTSMEFMNSFYAFSSARGNTKFTIKIGTTTYQVQIPDGNYKTHDSIKDKINSQLTGSGASFTYDEITHKFRLTAPSGTTLTFPSSNTNPYMNGIGYNLGFINTSYIVTGTYIESEYSPDIVQDTYVYLQINDWNLLEHQNYGQHSYSVFAKIQLTGSKNTIIFVSNYVDSSTKEYVFQQPVNIQRLEVKMIDAYGNTLDLRNGSFSMTLELQQVNSSAVYEDLIKL